VSGWGYGWRVAGLTWIICSAVVAVAGLILTQLDSQYDASGVAGRLLAGVGAGLLAMLLYSPLTLAVGVLGGLVAGLAHRRRRRAMFE
jgi:membrane protease YdiL (CAAX protease family)